MLNDQQIQEYARILDCTIAVLTVAFFCHKHMHIHAHSPTHTCTHTHAHTAVLHCNGPRSGLQDDGKVPGDI